MPIKRDWEHLNGVLETGLKDLLGEILDDATQIVDEDIRAIAQDLGMAAKRGRPELVQACRDQIALIVLEQELQVRAAYSNWFEQILFMGINALFNGAVAGLGSLKAV